MALATHSGDTDLLLPLPAAGEQWDPHLIHTENSASPRVTKDAR